MTPIELLKITLSLKNNEDEEWGLNRSDAEKLVADHENLTAALAACVKAMRDVQHHWSDPSSYSHNRLETPLLVHADTIKNLAV